MKITQPIIDQLEMAKAEQLVEFDWREESVTPSITRVALNRFQRDQLDLITRIEKLIEEEL